MTKMKPNYKFQVALKNEILSNFDAGILGTVLASSCGSGKTNMSIDIIASLLAKNPKLRILVLTHGTTVLRTQYSLALDESGHSFSSQSITDVSQIDRNIQVIVALPHAFKKSKPAHFDIIIVDEAHHFYFAEGGMIEEIIAAYKPIFQLLLTGSPSRFIKKKMFPIVSFAMLEALDAGVIGDPVIEIMETSYNFDFSSYNQSQDLKRGITVTSEQTETALHELLTKLEKTLCSISRANPSIRNTITSSLPEKWQKAFGSLGKTMIVTGSQQQATEVMLYFQKAGVSTVMSTSASDTNSLEMYRFQEDPSILVLVVVDRGILGFNFPGLVNVVDMSASLNIDRLFQLFSRLVRIHPEGKSKLFIKLTSASISEYTYAVMSFVMALSHKSWYEAFDGDYKRLEFPISKAFITRLSDKAKQRNSALRGTSTSISSIIADLPELPKLSTFTTLYHKSNEPLSSIAYTTLDLVRKALMTEDGKVLGIEDYLASKRLLWEKDVENLRNTMNEYGILPEFCGVSDAALIRAIKPENSDNVVRDAVRETVPALKALKHEKLQELFGSAFLEAAKLFYAPLNENCALDVSNSPELKREKFQMMVNAYHRARRNANQALGGNSIKYPEQIHLDSLSPKAYYSFILNFADEIREQEARGLLSPSEHDALKKIEFPLELTKMFFNHFVAMLKALETGDRANYHLTFKTHLYLNLDKFLSDILQMEQKNKLTDKVLGALSNELGSSWRQVLLKHHEKFEALKKKEEEAKIAEAKAKKKVKAKVNA